MGAETEVLGDPSSDADLLSGVTTTLHLRFRQLNYGRVARLRWQFLQRTAPPRIDVSNVAQNCRRLRKQVR